VVRVKKIVVGLSALVAVGALAACSSAAASGQPLAPAGTTTAAATSTVDTTSATPTTTAAPVKTTTVAPPVAKAPVTTKAPVVQAAAPVPGLPCAPTVNACVSIATRKAWLVENGKVVLGPVSIMPGRPGYRTPIGTFHVLSKAAHFWSTAFNAPMPDSVFFLPGYAFHIGSLSVFSHGCIHLSASAGATFFNTLHVGDEVQILSS